MTIVAALLSPAYAIEDAVREKDPRCPCTALYPIDKAPIAFLGRLVEIRERAESCPGFACKLMDMVFVIEEPWKGVPFRGKIRLVTDNTSCGYGDHIAPYKRPNKIGQSFAIFAQTPHVGICDSVVLHNSFLLRNRHVRDQYYQE